MKDKFMGREEVWQDNKDCWRKEIASYKNVERSKWFEWDRKGRAEWKMLIFEDLLIGFIERKQHRYMDTHVDKMAEKSQIQSAYS